MINNHSEISAISWIILKNQFSLNSKIVHYDQQYPLNMYKTSTLQKSISNLHLVKSQEMDIISLAQHMNQGASYHV